MTQGFFQIYVDCHTYPDDFATAKIMAIPKLDYLGYALPDKPDEVYSAEEFRTLLKKIRFERSSEIRIDVVNKNSQKRTLLRFRLSWPDQITTTPRVCRRGKRFTIPE